MSFSQRLEEIRTGFERPFWVANVTEIFERMSYYGAFAVLSLYLVQVLHFPITKAAPLASLFGGLVWFLAAFGGTLADRIGFRWALSLAYLILSTAYFLMGSLDASWMIPIRNAVPLTVVVAVVLMLPALGVALVKPSVVGTTARASKENVRSIGYSIYYTLVNIGGALGPWMASFIQKQMGWGTDKVFLAAALWVFISLIAVLIFFKEPRRSSEVQTATFGQSMRNFWTVLTNPKFMLFLLIFSGYWIVYWQEFLILPLYVTKYLDPNADTSKMLTTGPTIVIAFTFIANVLMQKVASFRAVILGTLISALAWLILVWHPSLFMAYVTLAVISIGEIIQSPRYYDYISRLAPPGQQGTYMGFAFMPIGIGSIIAGFVGGKLFHYYGEVLNNPSMIWWVITGIGVATFALLFVYDRIFSPSGETARAA